MSIQKAPGCNLPKCAGPQADLSKPADRAKKDTELQDIPLHPGFPRNVGGGINSGVTLYDLNGDGADEIIFGSYWGNHLYVMDSSGEPLPGFPKEIEVGIYSAPSIADIDADGEPEIVAVDNAGYVYVWRADGTEIFRRQVDPAGYFWTSPVLFNLDGDTGNHLEIVLANLSGKIFVLNDRGEDFLGAGPFFTAGAGICGNPAVADVNGDGLGEIFFPSDDGYLNGIGSDARPLGGSWPVPLQSAGEFFMSHPTIGDVDGDGVLNIVIATSDHGSLCVLEPDGSFSSHFPIALPAGSRHSNPLVDLDGDGRLEIISPTEASYLNITRYDGTSFNSHFPGICAFGTYSSPIVFDLTGDGQKDLCWGTALPDVRAIDLTNTMLAGFPITVDADVFYPLSVGEIDGDGQLELVATTIHGSVYVWDLPVSSDLNSNNWLTYQYDPAHTGCNLTNFTEVEETETSRPQQPILIETIYPRPANSRVSLDFSCSQPGAVKIRIFDMLGKVVREEEINQDGGKSSFIWDLRDGSGRDLPSGSYFIRLETAGSAASGKVVIVR